MSARLAGLIALAGVAGVAGVACTHDKPAAHVIPTASGERETEARRDERFRSELQEDILASYERDEPPEIETDMIRPEIGAARIGVGPGDLLVADELLRAPSRWPLYVDRDTPTQAVSKHLDAHHIWLARDRSAAWVFDEVSWRITVCARTAVVPLRMTALYAHDGDRWIPVFEHLSFAHTPAAAADGALRGSELKSKKMPEIVDELSRVLARGLLKGNPDLADMGAEPLLLGPDLSDEWTGAALAKARLVATTLTAEDRRVGIVGRTFGKATIAYWVGNFDADFPSRPGASGGKIRLRGTFVFQKVAGAWKLVQGHLSEPIDDIDLATAVFGTALVSLNPLRVSCE